MKSVCNMLLLMGFVGSGITEFYPDMTIFGVQFGYIILVLVGIGIVLGLVDYFCFPASPPSHAIPASTPSRSKHRIITNEWAVLFIGIPSMVLMVSGFILSFILALFVGEDIANYAIAAAVLGMIGLVIAFIAAFILPSQSVAELSIPERKVILPHDVMNASFPITRSYRMRNPILKEWHTNSSNYKSDVECGTYIFHRDFNNLLRYQFVEWGCRYVADTARVIALSGLFHYTSDCRITRFCVLMQDLKTGFPFVLELEVSDNPQRWRLDSLDYSKTYLEHVAFWSKSDLIAYCVEHMPKNAKAIAGKDFRYPCDGNQDDMLNSVR